jgi:hypothetical protein
VKPSGQIARALFALIAVLVTVASVSNVMLDNTEVLQLAEQTVCQGKPKCGYAKSNVARTPIGQTITFTSGKGPVEVVCRRAAIAFGDYSCKTQP